MSKFEVVTTTGEVLDLNFENIKINVPNGDKLTKQELVQFFQLCKVQQLNPFLKEAYIVKYGSGPAQLVVDYKELQKRAEKNTKFNGMSSGIVIQKDGGEIDYRKGQLILEGEIIVGGWCNIYRTDRDYPIEKVVSFKEFNKGQSTWKEKPAFMIEKVAKTHALREAFTADLTGMYVEDEMTEKKLEEVEVIKKIDVEYEENPPETTEEITEEIDNEDAYNFLKPLNIYHQLGFG